MDGLFDVSLFGVDASKFPVESGELTPQGMRQRYLKGRVNRIRYIDTYPLLSEEFSPGQVFIQTSHKSRTI